MAASCSLSFNSALEISVALCSFLVLLNTALSCYSVVILVRSDEELVAYISKSPTPSTIDQPAPFIVSSAYCPLTILNHEFDAQKITVVALVVALSESDPSHILASDADPNAIILFPTKVFLLERYGIFALNL